MERAALKALPEQDFDAGEWKDATLHADCYVYVEAMYHSAPHIHRHKRLRVKFTENQVEIFLSLERIAIHPRSCHRDGRRIFNEAHFPPASQAYYEATPQKLLSQSRFVHPELNRLFVDMFKCRCLRQHPPRAGPDPQLHQKINAAGHEIANLRIATAIATMRRYKKTACRTSRHCSPRHARRRSCPRPGARSCGAPQRQSHASLRRRRRDERRQRHSQPLIGGDLKSMSTAIAKNLMANMKLLGMMSAFRSSRHRRHPRSNQVYRVSRYSAAGRGGLSPGAQDRLPYQGSASPCVQASKTSTSRPETLFHRSTGSVRDP